MQINGSEPIAVKGQDGGQTLYLRVHQRTDGMDCNLVLGLIRRSVGLILLGSGREWLPFHHGPLLTGLASTGPLYWVLAGFFSYFARLMFFSHLCFPPFLASIMTQYTALWNDYSTRPMVPLKVSGWI